MDIKTFIFLDSETTGLPYQENYKTRITELCFIAVQSDHLRMGVFPRIQNKISLCFNPGRLIGFEASNITGLSNHLLEYQPTLNSESFGLLQNFINLQHKPICFVAHNGFGFDYPILKAELNKAESELPEDILCVDSILAFKALHKVDEQTISVADDNVKNKCDIPLEFQDGFDELLCNIAEQLDDDSSPRSYTSILEIKKLNETTPKKQIILSGTHSRETNSINQVEKEKSVKRKLPFRAPSFALGEVYKRLTFKEPKNAHRAECDVDMLIECAAVLGEEFVTWCNLNSKKFCDIPKMAPRTKI